MLLVMLVILLMLCRIFEVIPSPACLMFLLSMLSCIFPESPDNPPPPGKAKLPDNHGKDQVLGLPASPLTLISVWVAPPRILQPGTQKRANRANIFLLISSVYF